MTIEFEQLAQEKVKAEMLAQAKEGLAETLLDTCADQEYRICCLELGIN